MKFNGIEYYEGMRDKYRYPNPKLKEGQKIKFLFDNEETAIPGCKKMKRGVYDVLKVDESFFKGI